MTVWSARATIVVDFPVEADSREEAEKEAYDLIDNTNIDSGELYIFDRKGTIKVRLSG